MIKYKYLTQWWASRFPFVYTLGWFFKKGGARMSTKMESKLFEIVAGPSKDLLFDACKYAYSRQNHLTVGFKVAIGYTRPKNDPGAGIIPMTISDMVITSIQHEDGSGESFNIEGFCRANLLSITETLKSYNFNAYYETRTRRGTISFSR